MKKVLLAIMFLPAVLFAQHTVEGIVYEDVNQNGKPDKNEKRIEKAAVSNGCEITLTDEKGRYALPLSDDMIVFVIKPSGYGFPLNEFHQPRFYYIHEPLESPPSKKQGMGASQKHPAPVNFGLIKTNLNEDYRVLLFGDPQPISEEEVMFFHNGIVKELVGVEGIDFGISLGDIVFDRPDLYPAYIRAIHDIGIPWYNVMGNHDMNYEAKADSLSDETFERYFGPATFSFNHGQVHFILMDDVLYPDPRDGRGYWGGFTERQKRFLKNDLALVPKDNLVVLAFHIPISESEPGDPFRDQDRDFLFSLLKDFPKTLSISGHTHLQAQDFFSKNEGWLGEGRHHHLNAGTTCGDWHGGKLDSRGIPISTMYDGTPKGYLFLNISGNDYTFDYKAAGMLAGHQIGLYLPNIVEHQSNSDYLLYANFFIGSKHDTLWFRIDGGDWKTMRHSEEYDPSYLRLYYEWDNTTELLSGRRPSHPEKCFHLWKAYLPTDLSAGDHSVEVKAKDMFNRVFFQKGHYKVFKR